jgi:SAM-dependent methyltransferase
LTLSVEDVLGAWAARVRANRDQVDAFREASPSDFYAPVASLFRADPQRQDEAALEILRGLVQPEDVVLDIGAGGGRYALPLALQSREVVAIDPSEGMLRVLHESANEHAIRTVRVVAGRWPAVADQVEQGDVALIAHVGYDVERIGPFIDAMERAARRLCVAVLLSQPPPTEADRLWPDVHGVERATLPSLPEFLTVLLARGRLFDVRLVDRSPQTYESREAVLAWLRQQLWLTPDGPKDRKLQALLDVRLTDRHGRYALSWDPVSVGIVTWRA